ncbi:hypothetical protein PTKU46_82960 [Paraburkholderia terrae]
MRPRRYKFAAVHCPFNAIAVPGNEHCLPYTADNDSVPPGGRVSAAVGERRFEAEHRCAGPVNQQGEMFARTAEIGVPYTCNS